MHSKIPRTPRSSLYQPPNPILMISGHGTHHKSNKRQKWKLPTCGSCTSTTSTTSNPGCPPPPFHLPPRANAHSARDPVGGAARFVTLVNSYRDKTVYAGQPELVTLFSGDAFNPSIESSITKAYIARWSVNDA